MQDAAVVRRKLLADMRRAIDQGHLRVHYQPIIELATGVVTKAEALVRWEHPERGMVMPVDFIPLAEESGLIVDIGNWVFQEVVGQVARWKAQIHPAFQVSINESPVQLRDRRNLDGWLGRLVSANLPGRHVAIEITEAVMMQEDRGIRDQLLDLRDAGVEVALDDFGTGYSSLAYLKDLHVDYIKIDRSFVRNLATGAREQALCEAMIVMAHRLGLKVVSEGVETEEHCRLLREMGCDFAQGFHFGRPAPASELELRFATTAVGR
jgi:EAL domain-containing protein (putative c-di-GMP-specific phosphodiesterase class I)